MDEGSGLIIRADALTAQFEDVVDKAWGEESGYGRT